MLMWLSKNIHLNRPGLDPIVAGIQGFLATASESSLDLPICPETRVPGENACHPC
jgi:hypothetical protein